MLSKFFSESWKFVLDLIFPIECLGCKTEAQWICSDCLQSIKPFPAEKAEALKIKGCQKIFAAADYENPLVARSIHALKYKMIPELAIPLAKLITRQVSAEKFPPNSIFVPVPLHRRRLLERGFNQSELIAKVLSEHYHLPWSPKTLARRKHTKPQMSLKREARRHNINEAFQLIDPASVADKNVWIIDDVLTTGATIQACIKTLAPVRPKSINAIVIAHSAD